MLTLKQGEIKKMHAIDLAKVKGYKKGLSCIGKSYGVYGMNGAVFQDKNGKLYKITSRSSLLFKYC